jgi:hypothetical protein
VQEASVACPVQSGGDGVLEILDAFTALGHWHRQGFA